MSAAIKAQLTTEALAAGFDCIGVASPQAALPAGERLREFLALGRHGDMAWLSDKSERRADPHILWPEARSIILLGVNYGPASDPMEKLRQLNNANISCYAQGKDYHEVIKPKLKRVAGWLHRESGAAVKVFVDTAPVMEKPLAAAAGLGWQGKHTNLVSREFGSWLFLGAIFTDFALPFDAPGADHCGSCRACLDICPTKAFTAPYRLDARRCISYLTIEHQGHISREFRAAIGNRVYGCDDCLAVCPWNKWAQVASETKFHCDTPLPLAGMLALDDAAFRKHFAGSPVKRSGRARFVRNCLIAAGNSGDSALLAPVVALLEDASPLVRAMAVWAVRQLAAPNQAGEYRDIHFHAETDVDVRAEWEWE